VESTIANGGIGIGATRRPQLHNLTALRAVAALSIFLHHLKAFDIDASQSIWGMDLSCAVSFFFVLSGFVLSYSFEGQFRTSRDIRNFIVQRFFRLWPVHMLCSFFALVTLQGPTSVLTAYLTTTLQSSWIPAYGTAFAYNSVSWSISVELFFYLVLPFILILKPRQATMLICGWTFAVLGLFVLTVVLPQPIFPPPSEQPMLDLYVTDASFAQFFPPLRMVEFLSGVAVYQLFRRRRIPDVWAAFCQISAIIGLVLYASVHAGITQFVDEHTSIIASVAYREYGMYPLFAAMIYVFAHQAGSISRILSRRSLVFLGEISFAFYMIHQVVILNLSHNFEIVVFKSSIAAAILAGLVSLLFSIILHRSAESPCIAWAKRQFPMTRQPPPPVEIPLVIPA
jgi:peptidoglycan/LPS O-acetylase OafA/YrhL